MMIYVIIIYLLILSWFDIRTKKLPGIWIGGGFFVMGMYGIVTIIFGRQNLANLAAALLPGILIIVFSKISGQIGDGDGLLFLLLGFFFSVREEWLLIFLSFFLAVAGSLGIIISKRNCKNKRIPFVPFITVAVICIVIMESMRVWGVG